jgi:archaellum component FlaC
MLIIYLLIILFVGLLIYQSYLVEGYTDKDIDKKINDAITKLKNSVEGTTNGITKKITGIETNTTSITNRLTAVETSIKGIQTTNNTLSPLVPQLTTLAGQQPQINDLIQNSEEMDDTITQGQIAAGQSGDYDSV